MTEQTITHLFTTEQAVAFVKKADRTNSGRFCLQVHADAYIENDPDKYFPGALTHYLRISRKDALDLVSNMLRPTLEAKGRRIRITEYTYDNSKKATYWIG